MLRKEVEKLRNEWGKLQDQWKVTCEHWNDDIRKQFEMEFWHQFEVEVPRFIKDFEKAADSISKVCRELDLRV